MCHVYHSREITRLVVSICLSDFLSLVSCWNCLPIINSMMNRPGVNKRSFIYYYYHFLFFLPLFYVIKNPLCMMII